MLVLADIEPDQVAILQAHRARLLLQPQRLAVEPARLVLPPRLDTDADVLQSLDTHRSPPFTTDTFVASVSHADSR